MKTIELKCPKCDRTEEHPAVCQLTSQPHGQGWVYNIKCPVCETVELEWNPRINDDVYNEGGFCAKVIKMRGVK